VSQHHAVGAPQPHARKAKAGGLFFSFSRVGRACFFLLAIVRDVVSTKLAHTQTSDHCRGSDFPEGGSQWCEIADRLRTCTSSRQFPVREGRTRRRTLSGAELRTWNATVLSMPSREVHGDGDDPAEA
jgi:hypothetical protein